MPDAAPKTLAEALVALQAQLPRIPKTDEAQVGTRTYRYANLATITDLLMPIMAKLGLSWTCRPTRAEEDSTFVLWYTLAHVGGERMDGYYPLPSSGTPQQIGSAITYARRYALTAVTGIAPADDDDDAAAAERAAALMSPGQAADHAELRLTGPPRRAERSRGPVEDEWTDRPAGDWPVPPEDQPGSSTKEQHQRLGILYGQLGIKERGDRLTDLTNRTGRRISSARDLWYTEAQQAIKELTELAAKAAD